MGIKPQSLEQLLALASGLGFTSATLPRQFVPDDAAAEAARSLAVRAGVPWRMFYLPFDVFSDKNDLADGLALIKAEIPRAVRTGATITYNHVFSGSDSRDFAANFAWHRERLARLYEILQPMGVRYCLEFIGPKTYRVDFAHEFIYTLEQTIALADAVSPEIGIAFDLFHFYTSGGAVEQLGTLDAKRVYMVHANDAQSGRTRDEQMNLERAMPMATGIIDARAMLRALAAGGFTGPVFAEPFSPKRERLSALPAEQAAAEAIGSLRRCL